MAINDLYTDGIASGWDVRDASRLTAPLTLEADVAIIGSGAGGATSAEILSAAGLKVLLIEEGALKTAADLFPRIETLNEMSLQHKSHPRYR